MHCCIRIGLKRGTRASLLRLLTPGARLCPYLAHSPHLYSVRVLFYLCRCPHPPCGAQYASLTWLGRSAASSYQHTAITSLSQQVEEQAQLLSNMKEEMATRAAEAATRENTLAHAVTALTASIEALAMRRPKRQGRRAGKRGAMGDDEDWVQDGERLATKQTPGRASANGKYWTPGSAGTPEERAYEA